MELLCEARRLELAEFAPLEPMRVALAAGGHEHAPSRRLSSDRGFPDAPVQAPDIVDRPGAPGSIVKLQAPGDALVT
jgi:hypothetical protein